MFSSLLKLLSLIQPNSVWGISTIIGLIEPFAWNKCN